MRTERDINRDAAERDFEESIRQPRSAGKSENRNSKSETISNEEKKK